MFIQYENNDNLMIYFQNYCREKNILNAYFIIDEAHNFDNQDKVKTAFYIIDT